MDNVIALPASNSINAIKPRRAPRVRKVAADAPVATPAPIAPTVKATKNAPTRRSIPKELGTIDQLRIAFSREHWLAALIGILFGGAPVFASFWVSHVELDCAGSLSAAAQNPLSILVLAGLAFSAPKVITAASEAFGHWTYGVAFTVLMEGTMTFVPCLPVAIGVGVLILLINVAHTTTGLARRERL